MKTNEMEAVCAEVCDVLKTLANPGRLMALCELAEGERSVGDLASRVGLRDQTMSQQLSILRAKGYVDTRREGQTIYYAISQRRPDIRRVILALHAEYCRDNKALAAE